MPFVSSRSQSLNWAELVVEAVVAAGVLSGTRP